MFTKNKSCEYFEVLQFSTNGLKIYTENVNKFFNAVFG